MDHSMMNHGSDAPTTTSRTPIPVLTDADRQAAFPPLGGHQMHDSAINSFFLLDKLEYQDADEGSALAWDASGWVGGDINRLWFRSEGERTNGVTEDAELQLLYGRSIGHGGMWSPGSARISNRISTDLGSLRYSGHGAL
jgi:copper resistance protein B